MHNRPKAEITDNNFFNFIKITSLKKISFIESIIADLFLSNKAFMSLVTELPRSLKKHLAFILYITTVVFVNTVYKIYIVHPC